MSNKINKAEVYEQISAIKDILGYSKMDAVAYDKINEVLYNDLDAMNARLEENNKLINEDITQKCLEIMIIQGTLDKKILTDNVYTCLYQNHNVSVNVYDEIYDAFDRYQYDKQLNEYTFEFMNTLPVSFDMIVSDHFANDSKHNSIVFDDVSELENLFKTAVEHNKIDSIFNNIDETCRRFQNEIESSSDVYYMVCFEVGVSLSNIYSRFVHYGVDAI